MSAQVSAHVVQELVDLLSLERIEDNLFRGKQPDTLMQRVFGPFPRLVPRLGSGARAAPASRR